MTWTELESLVAEAYRCRGYAVLETGRRGPDGGVDLVVERDGKHLVQCKHWKAYRVGVKEVHELFGLVAGEPADGGILVTSGDFTQEARAFAAGKSLQLIDGAQLMELVRSVQVASRGRSAESEATVTGPVATSASTQRTVTPAEGQQPSFEDAERTCPRCGRAMVVRTARRGVNGGNQFLGCSGYPQCRATEPLPA
jgi:restriction system protein